MDAALSLPGTSLKYEDAEECVNDTYLAAWNSAAMYGLDRSSLGCRIVETRLFDRVRGIAKARGKCRYFVMNLPSVSSDEDTARELEQRELASAIAPIFENNRKIGAQSLYSDIIMHPLSDIAVEQGMTTRRCDSCFIGCVRIERTSSK